MAPLFMRLTRFWLVGEGEGGKNSPSTQDGLPGLFTKQNLVFDIS